VTAAALKYTKNRVAAGRERGLRHLAFDPPGLRFTPQHNPPTLRRGKASSDRSEKISFAKFHARVPQQVIGGCRVKVEVRKDEAEHIITPREGHFRIS